jgi:hypothetical protein
MIEYFRDLRLIPIAVVASTCLLALVAADLLLGHLASLSDSDSPRFNELTVIHAAPGAARPVDSKRSWAQQMFNFPDPKAPPPRQRDDMSFLPVIPPLPADTNNTDIITGSVLESGGEKGEKPKGERGAEIKEAADTPAADKQSGEKQTVGKQGSAKEPKPPTALSFPSMPRLILARRRPNGRSWNACRSGGRSWKSARANSTFAKA